MAEWKSDPLVPPTVSVKFPGVEPAQTVSVEGTVPPTGGVIGFGKYL